MSIESWELTASAKTDRWLLKIRGDRADAETIARDHSRVCQAPRELSDPVYQWVVIVSGATMSERLAIQDHVRELVKAPANGDGPAFSVDLSGVLAELSLVLEELTGLTDDEKTRAAAKMREIQEREAQRPALPQIPPELPPQPPPPPSPSPVAPPEPPPGIVRDVAPPPRPPTGRPNGPPPLPPAPPPANGTAQRPAAPPPAAPEPPAVTPAAPPPPPPAPASAGPMLSVALFTPSGADTTRDKFITTMTDVARTKAKKPMALKVVLSQNTVYQSSQAGAWIESARAAGAECFFLLLPPEIFPDFLPGVAEAASVAGVPCLFVPQNEVDSRLFYVDLMVELMLMKRKKS